MRRVLRDRVRQRVLVTLKSGETFAGVLWEYDREAFVLKDATQLNPGEAPIPVDGEWIALAAEVLYLQVP